MCSAHDRCVMKSKYVTIKAGQEGAEQVINFVKVCDLWKRGTPNRNGEEYLYRSQTISETVLILLLVDFNVLLRAFRRRQELEMWLQAIRALTGELSFYSLEEMYIIGGYSR